MKTVKNIAASVRQRLLNRARSDNRPFSELLQYYAMERFLYRLSNSVHADRFILKGALMLRAWRAPQFRPTMDIDMLGKTSNEVSNIVTQIQEILAVEVEPDGLNFDVDSIKPERITEDADYEGIRVTFRATLDSARINMQVDIGFGDIIHPGPEVLELPTILDFPPPSLLSYSRESAIAEKFEAMVKLGMLNSRMKDFYDIWLLSRHFNFEGSNLAQAIRLTFEQRGSTLTADIAAFEDSFAITKQVQWAAFCKRMKQDHIPKTFAEVVTEVEKFLSPVVAANLSGQPFSKSWAAAATWS